MKNLLTFQILLVSSLLIFATAGCINTSPMSSEPTSLSQTTQQQDVQSPTLAPAQPSIQTPVPVLTSAPQIVSAENATQLVSLAQWNADTVEAIAWSPDNLMFVASTVDEEIFSIKMYDVHTYHEIWSVFEPTLGVAINPSGDVVAFSPLSSTERLMFLDAATGRPLGNIVEEECIGGFKLIYDPNGDTILTAYSWRRGGQDITHITLWDINAEACLGEIIRVERYLPFSFMLSPNGQFLVASFGRRNPNEQPQTYVWDFVTREEICHLPGILSAFHPVEYILAVPDPSIDATINLWDITTCQITQVLTEIAYPYGSSLTFSPDGTILVTGTDALYFWDVSTGNLLKKVTEVSSNIMDRIIFSPDGRFILSVSSKTSAEREDTITLWGIRP